MAIKTSAENVVVILNDQRGVNTETAVKWLADLKPFTTAILTAPKTPGKKRQLVLDIDGGRSDVRAISGAIKYGKLSINVVSANESKQVILTHSDDIIKREQKLDENGQPIKRTRTKKNGAVVTVKEADTPVVADAKAK